MARVAGVELPNEKPICIGLTAIYGVGRQTALRIAGVAGIDPQRRGKDLTEGEVSRITSIIQSDCKVEGELRREVSLAIKRLMDIGCYRGLRHRRGLPVRGQRTSTNARTCKGPKKTVGVRRKKAA